jgi:dipeptidyl aminopeptidase/acylaminoacyl peptidase
MLRSISETFFSLLLIACGLAAQVSVFGQTPPPASARQSPTIEQWMSLRVANAPRISPDGRQVVYQHQETDWEKDSLDAEIWIAEVATGERRQLTNAARSSTDAEWSPDGKRIAYISSRQGSRQIYLTSPQKDEAIQLTRVETGVNSFRWSRDGSRLAFTTTEAESQQLKERREKFGDLQIVDVDPTRTASLWVLEVPLGGATEAPQPTRLTPPDNLHVGGFNWSPDAQSIAFAATKDAGTESFLTSDIYVVSLPTRAVRKVVDSVGPDNTPVWSPDGKEIAYLTYVTPSRREYFYYTNGWVAVVPAVGGAPRILTEQFDEAPALLAWSPDGIYFGALQKTSQHLFRLDPMSGHVVRLSQPVHSVFTQFSFSSDFKQTAFMGADSKTYPEVYVAALNKSFERKRLTSLNDQLKDWKIATRELVEWKSKDGMPIEGVLIKPADFDASKKYPLLVVIHTGPSVVDQPTITRELPYPVEMFAARGALILRPNYRGSIGYGERLRSALVRNLGTQQYWDIITGVDHLISQGIVDATRVGAMGYSHGGYLAAFLTTYSDRFKAISIGAGVSDWKVYYTNSDAPNWALQYLKATPWDDPEIYRSTAPITYIKQAKTPTLIQHGEHDRRAPVESAYELYRGLKDRGVPVKLIIYKGMGHVPPSLKHQRALMEQNYEWFGQWIWNEKPAP